MARRAGDIGAEHIGAEDIGADDWRAHDRGVEHDCGTEANRLEKRTPNKTRRRKESGAADLSVDDAGFVRSAAPPAGRP
ncbi:MAG: hypothetical protein HZA68_18735 [Rhodovulum sp.]|nr:hypothetical protein [Rhodovulum sp.]